MLLKVMSYVSSDSNVPLVVSGEHGIGKTSFLNECIKEIRNNR